MHPSSVSRRPLRAHLTWRHSLAATLAVLMVAVPSIALAQDCPVGAFCEEEPPRAPRPEDDDADDGQPSSRDDTDDADADASGGHERESMSADADDDAENDSEGDGDGMPNADAGPIVWLTPDDAHACSEGCNDGSFVVADDYTEEPKNPVLDVGAAIFGVGFGIPFVVGLVATLALEEHPDAAPLIPLMLPIAGPLATGALYDVSEPMWSVLGAVSGIQAVGLVVMAVGAAIGPDEPRTLKDASAVIVEPTPSGIRVRF